MKRRSADEMEICWRANAHSALPHICNIFCWDTASSVEAAVRYYRLLEV
jgi:hypothetical protein